MTAASRPITAAGPSLQSRPRCRPLPTRLVDHVPKRTGGGRPGIRVARRRLPADEPTLTDRLRRLATQAATDGFDAVLVSPGPDMAYFVGHSVASHERLTCLVVPADGEPQLLVPTLERPGWSGTPGGVPRPRDQHLDRRRGPVRGPARRAAARRPGARRGLPHARGARARRAGRRARLRAATGR